MGSSKEGKIRSAPAYTIVGRNKPAVSKTIGFPGPGSYNGKFELLLKKPPHYSMGERVQNRDKHPGPGPGAHNPEKV